MNAAVVRDTPIGRNANTRIRLSHRGLGLSCCLVRICLRCHNLPCKAHAVALHRLTTDCERFYRQGPLLGQTLCTSERCRGKCHCAPDWIHGDHTSGRSKLDVDERQGLPVTDILPLTGD